MKDYEYEEENLDDFMVNAATILSEKKNPEKETIIESLKQHLSSIFQNQAEMENFFRTLNGVIFTSKETPSKNSGQLIDNKLAFLLYPIIFSFNPKTTSYYFDYYLKALQQCIHEENRPDFTFLSEVFSDVINTFFTDGKKNKNLIKKSYLLEQNKKNDLYEKILNFCNEKITTNKKLEQSFGCLLLTEFIEKCPLVKEDNNLNNLFTIISGYLDDRWFECKLDLLNCTISLIFAAEEKFKPYANICLFRILDYLTDPDGMKRKLAINIVYTLVFYCKDEIIEVKDNIIEFLNILKEDSIEEIRDVCHHILRFLGEENKGGTEGGNPKNGKKNQKNTSDNSEKTKKNQNKIIKLNNSYTNNNVDNNFGNQSSRSIKSNIKNKKKNKSDENMKLKILKEQANLDKNKKENLEKKKNNHNMSSNKSKTSSHNNCNTISDEIQKSKPKENSFILSPNEKSENNKNKSDYDNEAEITSSINSIFEQLKKIQEEQDELRKMLKNIKEIVETNYSDLNERIKALEKKVCLYSIQKMGDKSNNRNWSNDLRALKDKKSNKVINITKVDDKVKIEELKSLFNKGKYNEALIETYQNDRYLFKLLPLIEKKVIPKIEIAVLEDIISRLNKRIPVLCMEEDREKINEILLFYSQLLQTKKQLKLITQLSIKDVLNFLKSKGTDILNEEDMSLIENIISSLKTQEIKTKK